MRIVATYSFNDGENFISQRFPQQLAVIQQVIQSVNAQDCKNKISRESTNAGTVLYSPPCLNTQFEDLFNRYGWQKISITCEYGYGNFLAGYVAPPQRGPMPRREMDFIHLGTKLGVEVQFGKYAFMSYDICVKMPIFHNQGLINAGVEIVPTKHLADEMITGVSYFEQIAWDLQMRGPSNVDIPVLILGVDA